MFINILFTGKLCNELFTGEFLVQKTIHLSCGIHRGQDIFSQNF
jgi:hypothetical protein